MKHIKKWLKILQIKWLKGQCRHICAICQYRSICMENFELEMDEFRKQNGY